MGTKNTGKVGNIVVASLVATQGFPLLSFHLGSAREIRVPPMHQHCEHGDASGRRHLHARLTWSTQAPRRHLGQWRRLWGPRQSWLSSLKSLRMRRPSQRRSAEARGSTPSWRRCCWRWIWSPAWSR